MEAEEYKQKQRLQSLLEARKKVEEKADEAREYYVAGKIDRDTRNIVVFHAVKEYIREVWTLLRTYWEDRDEDDRPYMVGRQLGEVQLPDGNITIDGLYEFLHAPDRFVGEREVTKEFPHGPDKEFTETVTETVPLEVSWEAALAVTEFLANEHGLELQFEAMDDSLESFGFETIDISDLDVREIEEIEEFVEGGIDARAVTQDGGVENGNG
jgi:hypothetical protein